MRRVKECTRSGLDTNPNSRAAPWRADESGGIRGFPSLLSGLERLDLTWVFVRTVLSPVS